MTDRSLSIGEATPRLNCCGFQQAEDFMSDRTLSEREQVDYGSHSIIIDRVSEVMTGATEACLIYCSGGYH